MLRRICPLLLALAACSGSAQSSRPPAPPSGAAAEEPPEDAPAGAEEELVSVFERLAEDLPRPGACDDYAETVSGWVEAHAGEVRELTRRAERGSELEPAQLASLEERLEVALARVLEGADACTESEPAQAAFAAFDDLLLGG